VSVALTQRSDGEPSEKPIVHKLRHAPIPSRKPARPAIRFTCPTCGVTSLFQPGERDQPLALYLRSPSAGLPVWCRTVLHVHRDCVRFILPAGTVVPDHLRPEVRP
jgi:hypothetical protein